ncbi:MAG: hypothetical protein ACREB0_05405 [Sphingopyxis sp.]
MDEPIAKGRQAFELAQSPALIAGANAVTNGLVELDDTRGLKMTPSFVLGMDRT